VSSAGAGREVVLVIDDNAGIRRSLADVLEDAGYPVATAADGDEALRYLRTHQPPGLILLDLMMPGKTGWDFAGECREDPDLAGIPVVLLSGVRDIPEQRTHLKAAGFLRKPVDVEVLLQIVKMYCG
jgi:CheY-like chemotaxis protein